ncbi:DUF2339 domain-containing protein [Lentibacter algarum]|uniref:DUF2339 domain-containing protein n=1 Tax=Lentibacter algarum TaxID=576131 RepID=UPI001C068E08|nr:DUF2339 domain-containing protein [Lentibacter algarum]MBU2980998.1 DUF2339 domain-containing protein [Lentibacter algarum]
MDELVLIAVLFGLLIVIGVPYALIAIAGLKARLSRLEKEHYALSKRVREAATEQAPKAKAAKAKPPTAKAASKPEIPAVTPPPKAQKAPKAQPIAASAQDAAPKASRAPEPPEAFVLGASQFERFGKWMRENWVLAVAAASLALAGVFMVQYGIEHGVLSPFWRVMAALGFGAALIAAGEVLRRRFGDETEGSTRYLPSTLSGAGIVVLFAGVLSAKLLYGLVGTNTALFGLVVVSVFAMVLGWFYGPLLAAIGVIGAMVAPFTLSTGAGAPNVLYYYFALIAVMALGIDTIKRWAWVSVLGLVLGFAAICLLFSDGTGTLHFLGSTLAVALAAVIIPQRSLVPTQGGAAVSDFFRGTFPEFPTRLSAGAMLFASLAALAVTLGASSTAEEWLGYGTLVFLSAGAMLWMARAPALFDHAFPPLVGFVVALLVLGPKGWLSVEQLRVLSEAQVEAGMSPSGFAYWVLLGFAALLSLVAFWRMRAATFEGNARPYEPQIWALVSAVTAPLAFFILEFTWPARDVIGNYPWALTAIALAAFMTFLTERTVAAGGDKAKQNAGLFALAAMTLVALALFIILSKTALSLALAAMVLGIVVLGRRIELPALAWFAQLGLAVITYRLIADPGIYWAIERASVPEVLLAYGGVLLILGAAYALLSGGEKLSLKLGIEAAGMLVALAGIIALLSHWLDDDLFSHWGMGLLATLWGAALLAQLHRMRGTTLRLHRILRLVLMALFAFMAGLALIAQATILNPLFGFFNDKVIGPPVLDSLLLAYLPVAAMFAFAAWKFAKPDGVISKVLASLASVYGAVYVALEIRRLFRGNDLSVAGVTNGELYAYTVAMLVGAGLMLMLAFSRRSVMLRKIAMGLVALTIAKVFLIDMSGLTGLTRVFSFMGLGLALLGLTWVNRLMTEQWERGAPKELPSE